MVPAQLMHISDPVTTRTKSKAGGGLGTTRRQLLASHAGPGREGPEQGSSRGKRALIATRLRAAGRPEPTGRRNAGSGT